MARLTVENMLYLDLQSYLDLAPAFQKGLIIDLHRYLVGLPAYESDH